jgi:hypothetical protein
VAPPITILARWADRDGDHERDIRIPDPALIPLAGEFMLVVDEDGYRRKLDVVERHFVYGGGSPTQVVLWCKPRA